MHIYFSGIGGTGIGPLALIAHNAGFEVSGSDKINSSYIDYLKSQGLENITIGQTQESISKTHENNPIDWFVYSSALPKENPLHPELLYTKSQNIKSSKRDEFLSYLLEKTNKKMIAVAGTHGKTTTTAMMVWLFKELKIPISYSVGAKISFGEMGEFDEKSEYFVYEADEYDRNFLSYKPEIAIISGIAYDHADIYPTVESYNQAFVKFLHQSKDVYAHPKDLEVIGMSAEIEQVQLSSFTLLGEVNRANAQLVVEAAITATGQPAQILIEIMNRFPGVSRRFERITENIYSDYAHTPEKIAGALQLAHEVAGDNVAVVYEGLHNTRQHFIKDQLKTLFDGVKKLYIVPSYLAREDESLEMLTPEKLCKLMDTPSDREPEELGSDLKLKLLDLKSQGFLVLCLTAGGGGSLDEWLRAEFKN